MSKQFGYLVFIGRFQPFHIGHKRVIEKALDLADNVIILLGSAHQPRTPKNPWTAQERATMIYDGLDLGEDAKRVIVVPLRDQMYNDQKWVGSVQQTVDDVIRGRGWTDYPPRVGLIGHSKDESSYYLKMFPQWTLIDHDMDEILSATDLRELYFEGKNLKFLQSLVPPSTFSWLEAFRWTPDFTKLAHEYQVIKDYKQSWSVAPHPPTFTTCDAVVIQSGHILLIERKAAPGAGSWALPGGFVDVGERIIDGVVRELREETRLKVPDPVIRGSIKASHVFDHPNRSLRGRTITHAFLIELAPGELPKVKGGDDAKKAQWFSLNDVDKMSDQLFEDHFDIINYFLGRV